MRKLLDSLENAQKAWVDLKKDAKGAHKLFKDATVSAFVVFSPDSSVVELFLPDMKKHPLLQKEGDSWKNKTFEVKRIDGKLALYKKGKLIYQE